MSYYSQWHNENLNSSLLTLNSVVPLTFYKIWPVPMHQSMNKRNRSLCCTSLFPRAHCDPKSPRRPERWLWGGCKFHCSSHPVSCPSLYNLLIFKIHGSNVTWMSFSSTFHLYHKNTSGWDFMERQHSKHLCLAICLLYEITFYIWNSKYTRKLSERQIMPRPNLATDHGIFRASLVP